MPTNSDIYYISSFTYGHDARRIRMTVTDTLSHKTITKDYVGSCEFVDDNGSKKVYTYLKGPYGVFAFVEKANGRETLYYVYKDHLGSWTTITNATGSVLERRSFDAWGNLRDAQTWSGIPQRLPKYDRGYTGHEHLYSFGLINMNGRMYDPLLSSFLSPDNYMQDPTTQQGFNRYAYCMYNPLKYVDPSGEQYLGWNGGSTYYLEEAYRDLMRTRYYQYLELMQQTSDHINALINGLCLEGDSGFGSQRGRHGNGGGHHGGGIGGGGVNQEFLDKCKELGITPGKSIPEDKRTDAFLKEFQEAFFPDAPMEYVKKFIVEGLDKESEFLRGTTWNEAKTIPDWIDDMFSGYSSVYFNEDFVFHDPEKLFYAMGHELVHVCQIIELTGDPRQNWCNGLICVMDVYAYSWMTIMGHNRPWNNDASCRKWQSYKDCFNYTNFPCLNNIPHP